MSLIVLLLFDYKESIVIDSDRYICVTSFLYNPSVMMHIIAL